MHNSHRWTQSSNRNDISIHLVVENEIPTLHKLALQTFTTAFAHLNDPSDMDQYIEESMQLHHFEKQWHNPYSFFYFVKHNQEPIGYLKLNTSKAQSDTVLQNAMELERIYVQQKIQSGGIGRSLIQFAKAKAKSEKLEWIWLGVWEYNTKAIKFYEREGFQLFGKHNFLLGSDQQVDLLFRHKLIYR